MRRALTALAIALSATSGAAIPQVPPAPQHVQPAEATYTLSTLKGSQIDRTLMDDFTVYVLNVDGDPIMAGESGWSTSLSVAPGIHRITAAFIRGDFSAQVDIDTTFEPSRNYTIKFTTDAKIGGSNSYCDFWIVDDQTGKTISSIKRGDIKRAPGIDIPIFIPAGK